MEAYMVVHLEVEPQEPGREILIAWLSETAFDSFEETPLGLKAYIPKPEWDESLILDLEVVKSGFLQVKYWAEELENINWNEEWERHYEPIRMDKDVLIRAPFHPAEAGFRYELLIEPKMSFGTGHHQTTRLMCQQMLDMDLNGLQLCDMGTGTGILAILAEKMGAASILAVDNFEWAVENTAENAKRNHCKAVFAEHGDAQNVVGKKFDGLLANINRNVLLEDMATYVQSIVPGGFLMISGFFEEDRKLLEEEALSLGLKLDKAIQEQHWASCRFVKS